MNPNQYTAPFECPDYTASPRVLIVDHDVRYLRLIDIELQNNLYETLTAQNASDAVALAAQEPLDLILLEFSLPDARGDQVCKQIREFSEASILMLMDSGSVDEIVEALDAGAADCVIKPFCAEELLARIRAVLRRSANRGVETPRFLRSGNVSVNLEQQRIFRNREEIHLTPTEYKLLVELMQNTGKVLVPDYLLEAVWGYRNETQPRLLWQVIHRLRQKIEPDPSHPTYIHTRRGIGYLFSTEVD
jgi:DNA-binding response OmpR family regulator